jgi:signal peptidase I
MAKRKKKGDPKYGRAARAGGSKGEDGSGARAGSARKKEEGGLVELAKSIAIAGVLFVVLRAFILQTFVITSGSMEPTLLVGDFLMVNRLSIGSRIPFTQTRLPGYSSVRRRDVVVFDPHHEPDLKLVKRLIGLPGDTVQMVGGDLILNGEPQVEPYVRHRFPEGGDQSSRDMAWQVDFLLPGIDRISYRPTRDDWGPLVVPEEHYFMLGDNRDTSLDSRYWGMLASWRLEGRAVFKYFSYERGTVPFAFFRRIRWGEIFSMIR